MNKKMKKAIAEGRLISYDELFASYPKKRREEILRRSRYLRAAIVLRKFRKQFKISQQKLADKMKVKREFISRIESGRQNVTLETFYRIAEAMDKKFEFGFR